MGGGTIQLAAYGEQDVYLTGNPVMSYFKYVYKRYTNFAIETIEYPMDSETTVGETKTSLKLNSHSGDLIYKCNLQIEFTADIEKIVATNQIGDAEPLEIQHPTMTFYSAFTNNTGYAYIKEVSVAIGEQVIDTHYSVWFDVWNELTDIIKNDHIMTNKNSSKVGNYQLVKRTINDGTFLYDDRSLNRTDTLTCYVPLQFWFCRNPGLALPLVALQHHSVKFYFTFRKMTGLFNTNLQQSRNPQVPPKVTLLVDYIYLDKEERTKFATSKHQYLIEQVQTIQPTNLQQSHRLTFNHPVKEILWICRNKNAGQEATDLTLPITVDENNDTTNSTLDSLENLNTLSFNNWKYNDYFNYTTSKRDPNNGEVLAGVRSYEPFKTATLYLNNIQRFTPKKPSYFRIVQPSNYHSKVPNKHIYSYSFALKPEQLQPSGTCNFSLIQNIEMRFENPVQDSNMEIMFFAINYNMLCIMNGMGGLRFSN